MPALPAEFQPVYDSFIRGEIYFHEMVKQGEKMGVTIAMYDPVHDRNPVYPIGNNYNRVGFTHSLSSVKGKLFQNVMKPAIITLINKMHKWVVGEWDHDAYIYDDPRMQVLDENIHGYIDEFFDQEQRKLDFMHKIADIGLFILKEDIYYSARAFDMANKLPFFVLTTHEQENISTFTEGVGAVDQFTMEKVTT